MNVRERLAELCHEQWSGWMEYLFSKCVENKKTTEIAGNTYDYTSLTIPSWAVERWGRQMKTPYKDLSEEEKESDRKEADKILALGKEIFDEDLKTLVMGTLLETLKEEFPEDFLDDGEEPFCIEELLMPEISDLLGEEKPKE